MRALIVGGGPAGTTAALALGRVGIETLVVEREDRARPVGIGLALQNSPLRALSQLGLLGAVVEHGYAHEAVNICAPDGTVVHRIVTETLVPGTPSLVALPRVTLAEILEDALTRTPGAEIRYRTSITALRDTGGGVEADLTDGSTEGFDLVVGADGVHSAVRALVFPDAPEPHRARQVIWRASAPRPPEVDRYLLHDLGPRGRVGVVPMSDEEIYVWMLESDDGAPRPPAEQRLQLFRDRLAGFGGVVPLVADLLRPDVDHRALNALLVPAPWHRGRVVLIGDAAHATTPHIAYGAGMAIEDSVVLAEELSRGDSVAAAFVAFMARRFDRCRLVVETSLQLSEWEVDPPEDRSQHQQARSRSRSDHVAGVTLPSADELRTQAEVALRRCGVDLDVIAGDRPVTSPVNGWPLASVRWQDAAEVDDVVTRAGEAFRTWRTVPAPVRGGLVRRLGELLREHKDDLGTLVSLEVGKIGSEARGEVQEMIDICEFAVGLSRQLYGRTISSERPGHRLMETWHPLGVVGVISAFNFPVAVWSWNTALSLVCGDPVVWKPSELAPLSALASAALLDQAIAEQGAPEGLSQVLVGGSEVGEALVDHPGIALLSATGSTRMGRAVGPRVADRFGRSLLELGGNNAAVVTPSADLDLTTRGIVFSAAGTAGQRCTTMRRVLAHEDVIDEVTDRVAAAYRQLPIGSPVGKGTLVGPLIGRRAYEAMQAALEEAQVQGGKLVVGGRRRYEDEAPDAYYVEPAVVRMPVQTDVVARETFAPILYVLPYRTLDEAIALNNDVPQGLSSSIFTGDQAEAERFLAADGSDCGIANVNIGTSGAEIGGAFGGEKETGGGRESGSDAWKSYMRRATNTINYSGELPLAQGVTFTV